MVHRFAIRLDVIVALPRIWRIYQSLRPARPDLFTLGSASPRVALRRRSHSFEPLA
jgi:hypothetical protein